MTTDKILMDKIGNYISVKENKVVWKSVEVKDMTFANLRDNIIGVGRILEEDFENSIYVVNIGAGIANMNNAVVAMSLDNGKLHFVGYAKEGLINQRTADKAISQIIERLSLFIV